MATATQQYQDVILLESLDTPYRLTDVTHLQSTENLDHIKKSGLSDVKLYQCDDELGHAFFTGFRGNALEIHHQNFTDGVDMQGKKNLMKKVPAKFVSTVFSLAMPHLSQGGSVRIIAPDHLVSNYHRLAEAIGRKCTYNVSIPYRHDEDSHSFMIGKNSSPLFGYPQINKLKKP